MEAKKGGTNNMYFSIQIDARLKSDFTYFCESCGLTVSDAVFMLAKQTIKKREIPFCVEPLTVYTKAVNNGTKSARLTIRMDREMQDEFSAVCDEIGITRSVLVRMFFMKCINDNKLCLS